MRKTRQNRRRINISSLKSLFTQNIHESWLIVGLAIGIIIGAILAIILKVNYLTSPLWGAAVISAFLLAYFRPKPLFICIMILAGLMLIFVRATNELSGANYIKNLTDEVVAVSGIIEGDPETDESGTSFKLGTLKFGDKQPVEGKLYISLSKNEILSRSDEVVLEGKLRDGFGTYAGYMYRPKLTKWRRPDPGDLVLRARNRFAERIRSQIPERESALGISYLLGMRSNLAEDIDTNLRTVGLVHIVVASGAHLSILVEVARKIFGKLSRFSGLLFSTIFIILFMCMVGFTPSIMRAGIMTILTLITWYCGRKIAPWRLILLVAAITLMIEPNFIANLGWLLSFASYAGIMILSPKLAKFFYGSQKPGFISSTILMTISATIMTLPITLYYYGLTSLLSIIANLLILPTLPFAMGLVFMTGLVANIPWISTFAAFLSTKLLDFHIAVVEFFATKPAFIIEIDPYQPWVFFLYLLVIAILSFTFIKRKTKKLEA